MFRTLIISASLTFFTSILCSGQSGLVAPTLTLFVQDASSTIQESAVQELQEEVFRYSDLRDKSKDHSRFLKKLFYRIQREYLIDYASNAELANLFIGQKKYDCVTGTALYSVILDALGIDYSIKETDFHVYLLVHLSGKDILLESTDPVYGFVDNPVVINDRIRAYRNGDNFDSPETSQITIKSTSPFRRDRVISLAQLAGLQYYNLATDAFNRGGQNSALDYMEIALSLYPNDRFNGFREILLIDAAQSMSSATPRIENKAIQ